MAEILGSLFIPVLILAVFIAIGIALWVASKRYKKIPPGKIGIFYGKEYEYPDPSDPTKKIKRGFRVFASGGKILLPFVEAYQELSTNVFQIEIDEKTVPNKDNVPMNIRGIATCNIGATSEDQMRAAESFLGKQEQMGDIIKNILLGHLRSIIGNMDINELLRKRDEFNRRVITESEAELSLLGIKVNLVIQDVNDAVGYIDALGKQAVAEAIKEADIKVSNAETESSIVKANNAAQVAEKEKEKDVKIAKYKVESDKEKAVADKALEIALVEQETTIKVKQANRDKLEKEAQILVEEQEVKRTEVSLQATVIKPAEAEKIRKKLEAEGLKDKVMIDADANAEVNKTNAEGEAAAISTNAEAYKKKAIAEGEGDASRIKSKLEAEAAGEEAKLLANARGKAAEIKEKLLGEAEGTDKLAEALKKMDERGQLILILDRLPVLLDHFGPSIASIVEAAFKHAAAGLSNIDNISIVDMGGNGNGINNMANMVPTVVAQALTTFKTLGIDPTELLKQLKIDPSGLVNMLSGVLKSNKGDQVTSDEIKITEVKDDKKEESGRKEEENQS